jgi:hypothetical protein
MVLYLGLPPNSGGSGGIDCQVDGHNSNSCVTGVNTTNTASTWALLTLPSASNLASGLQHSLVVTVHSSANSKVFLYGVDNINNVNGIRVEKLGSPGELAYDRNQIPATLWESELSSLGIGTFINMYSTNEQGANNGCANNPCRSLTQYYGDMQTLVQTEQAANSLADLIVASDPDTYGTVANNCGPMNNQSCTPIAQFEQQVNDLARNMGIGFVGVYSHIHPWNKLCFAGIGSCPASALNWYVSGDGKHLNNKGWDELAALYEAYLTDSYGPSFQWVSSPSNNALNPLRVFKNGVAQFEVNTGRYSRDDCRKHDS